MYSTFEHEYYRECYFPRSVLCKNLSLEVEALGDLVQADTAGSHTAVLGYTKARVEFPDLSASIDVLSFIVLDTAHQRWFQL